MKRKTKNWGTTYDFTLDDHHHVVFFITTALKYF